MRLNVNPDEDLFAGYRKKLYVDKSGMISKLNDFINDNNQKYVCVSRPRRFGKSIAAVMLQAYYSKGADSRYLFDDLEISKDPSYEEHLNKYNVIYLDMNGIVTSKADLSIEQYCNRYVMKEMREAFAGVELSGDISFVNAVKEVYRATNEKFVFIIDEYDVVIRDEKYASDLEAYLAFLVALFKSGDTSEAIALAYMTGILPIVKAKTQSKLNNFTEYTMLNARSLAPYVGFTEEEVKELAEAHHMDFEELRRWYNGYDVNGVSIYSPKSVITAIAKKRCDDYWSQTGSFDALKDIILMNFDGIKDDVARMIAGEHIEADVSSFRNSVDSIADKDDVFTYLIHLGYLSYDREAKECFIPNHEVKKEWIKSIKNEAKYEDVMKFVNESKALLAATINGDESAVAESVGRTHRIVTSNLTYNNEGSFQSAIRLAYFYAESFYTIISELPTGKGYADVAFIPFAPDKPAIVMELKRNSSPDSALEQIRRRQYPEGLEKYKGNMVLVGISYSEDTKEHYAKIERA